MTLPETLLLSVGLGLLGFIEPCTVGSSLLFVKYLEGRSRRGDLTETAVFALTRGLFIGTLGAVAAVVGRAVLPWQRGFWLVLGGAYVAVGILYLTGRAGPLMRRLGPGLGWARRTRGSVALGILFGLNIPACAAPLLAALFAASLGAATVARGFWTMAVFGLALSLPLVAVVASEGSRAALDRLAALAERVPRWTGLVFVALGAWSAYLSLA